MEGVVQRSFFEARPERVAMLRAAFAAWERTPFFAGACVRGPQGGVDCVHLVRALLVECGVRLPEISQAYRIDHASHSGRSDLVEWVETHAREAVREVEVAEIGELQPGDVLGIRVGLCVHHAAIVLDERRCGHVLQGYAVTASPLGMIRKFGSLDHVWRPLEDDVV